MFLIFRPTIVVILLCAAAVCLHTQPASRKQAPVIGKSSRHCKLIEASSPDGSPGNQITKYTEFEELPPVRCRFVRLTITDWPRSGNSPLGIMEFTVFGKPLDQAR